MRPAEEADAFLPPGYLRNQPCKQLIRRRAPIRISDQKKIGTGKENGRRFCRAPYQVHFGDSTINIWRPSMRG